MRKVCILFSCLSTVHQYHLFGPIWSCWLNFFNAGHFLVFNLCEVAISAVHVLQAVISLYLRRLSAQTALFRTLLQSFPTALNFVWLRDRISSHVETETTTVCCSTIRYLQEKIMSTLDKLILLQKCGRFRSCRQETIMLRRWAWLRSFVDR